MTSGGVEYDKNRSAVTDHQHHQNQPPPPAFQGVPNYPPPPQQQQQPPATGYPQPAQPYVAGLFHFLISHYMDKIEYHQSLVLFGFIFLLDLLLYIEDHF